jgi:hypothetical protein
MARSGGRAVVSESWQSRRATVNGRRLQGILNRRRALAPEVIRGRREAEVPAVAILRLVRRRAERDQLLARPDPVTREPHDIAVRQTLPAAVFGLPTVRIHEVCRPFLAIRSEYVSRSR